jgi:hypothetical protein
MRRAATGFAWLVGWGLLLASASGCGEPKSRDNYVPSAETARQAVEDVLVAWQKGQPPGKIETTALPVAVYVVDSHRRPGQKLRRFQILGEVPGSNYRCFAIRLTLEEPAEERKIHYQVLGVDPLWVLREEDHTMLSHWDHGTENGGIPATSLATKKQAPATGKP